MSKSTIKDTRVRLQPSRDLLEFIYKHRDAIKEIPENVANALKRTGYEMPSSIETVNDLSLCKLKTLDTKLLAELCNGISGKEDNGAHNEASDTDETAETLTEKDLQDKTSTTAELDTAVFLYLTDLRWLDNFLTQLRKEKQTNIFLYHFIEKCALILPQNEIIKRDPVLEARCQRLREEQENREYKKMTKDVDAVLKNYPEDTIAYQMKALNSQIIAVLQFVFSVAAGFVFGFLGIELIIGNLDFGLRLLLGIMIALIIALAEIYFLAKKLNEYDNVVDTSNQTTTPAKSQKAHVD